MPDYNNFKECFLLGLSRCKTLERLKIFGANGADAPEEDKNECREAYMKRMEELKVTNGKARK